MSILIGRNKVAGYNQPFQPNLFDIKPADHLLNDIQWLRGDTFSWQSGEVYTTAYQHLVNDIKGIAATSEVIGSYTITYYPAADGHKIVLPDQADVVSNIYDESGVAWYYILDETNTRFKLPRDNHGEVVAVYKDGYTGYRIYSDGYCEQWGRVTRSAAGIITVTFPKEMANILYHTDVAQIGADSYNTSANFYDVYITQKRTNQMNIVSPTAIASLAYFEWKVCGYLSSNSYVKDNRHRKYTYFYVGQYKRAAIEETAGLNSELFNSKVDIDSLVEVPSVIESYDAGISGYRIWNDGYCEQWGQVARSAATSPIVFTKAFRDTTYNIFTQPYHTSDIDGRPLLINETTKATTGVTIITNTGYTGFYWRAYGYLANGTY